MLLPAALLVAGTAAAENAGPPNPPTVFVLDGSSSMNAKIGSASKIATVRTELGAAIGAYGDRLSFGLVAYGHRKASNCADSQVLAKPGELTAETQSKLFDKIKPKGQAPVAAALSDAAKSAPAQGRFDIVLIADGGDTCDADICSTAAAIEEKSPDLRIHVVGFAGKVDDIKPLACLAQTTGGTLAVATNASELKDGLAHVLEAIAAPQSSPSSAAAAAPASANALLAGVGTAAPIDLSAQAMAQSETTGALEDLPPGTTAIRPIDLDKSSAAPTPAPPEAPAGRETAVNKSAAPPPAQAQAPPPAEPTPPTSDAPPVNVVRSVPIAPPLAPPPPESTVAAKTTPRAAPQVQLPVPVTFKAQVSEQGPRLQSGLTWRVYAAKAAPDGNGYKLLSTHREAMPTAALLPGEYLVNAAYGLSNLTKKIKVESGRSLEETFVLNTGGLKLAAVLPSGETLPESAVRFDILSDEEDQFGNRQTILHNAKPGVVIRLNGGAYRIESLYGDANAVVRADVTVEPGKITEATIKQTGSKTTFKLVQSLGGEALADTKWTILTSAGDVVKENAGALPSYILAPGSYAVVADHSSLSYSRKFSIEAGDAKQVEVVVDDGPTSPEEIKALTDPPEPPPPAAGVVAGDGTAPSPKAGAAFDGFSPTKPADPNAPLINPGVLLRGAR
jgi:Mg-chelatase subunit ChlD